MLQKNYCIGVDLGGTNIAVGIVDLNTNAIIKNMSVKTNAPRSCRDICVDIAALCRKLCDAAGLTMDDMRWIGAVTPGIIKDGVVYSASNLGWKNAAFRKILATETRRPTYVANDANAAAYAEAVAGAGRGVRSLIAVTIGTGVGGGIVIDGEIWEGFNGFGAELGHAVIVKGGLPCGCGRRGCLEAYCSATALVSRTKAAMLKNPDSLLWACCDGNIDRVNGKTPFLAKERGDKVACEVIDSYLDDLACGVADFINIFQPNVVCIGGGISREGEKLLAPLREKVNRESLGVNGLRTEIVPAVFKNDAGILGAALLGLQEDNKRVKTKEELICEKFDIIGSFVSATPYGSGHINDTKLIVTRDGDIEHKYILQRINTNVFKNPEGLMGNYSSVCEFVRGEVERAGGDPERETINVISAKDGKTFTVDEEGGYWRLLGFIKNSFSYDKVENPEQFYLAALAFGNFQYILRNFPAETLVETIPNFHNTPDRLRLFEEAVSKDAMGRASSVEAEIAFVRERREFAATLENAHKAGRLPLKVTHNDTKLNNILFDEKTGEALAVVDLDTIMPGYSVNDFGDSIRFGATTALEDEADLSKVNFDISLYELYVKGFIEGVKGGLSEGELEMLPIGAIMMTFECGTRFLTDYLAGDTYFKISRPGHNLDRARNQFKLVRDMEARLPEMHAIVKKYAK